MQIQIHSHEFILAEPYLEGHPLSAAEAKALNVLRSERIRNIALRHLAGLEKNALPGQPLTQQAIAEFRARVDWLNSNFTFTTKGNSRQPSATYDQELREVAGEKAREFFRPTGGKPSQSDWTAKFNELLVSAEVEEETRKRLALREEIALKALEDLAA